MWCVIAISRLQTCLARQSVKLGAETAGVGIQIHLWANRVKFGTVWIVGIAYMLSLPRAHSKMFNFVLQSSHFDRLGVPALHPRRDAPFTRPKHRLGKVW